MTARPLSPCERDEASRVFALSLRLEAVRIHEGVRWTSTVARWHARLRGLPPPSANAITLGYHVNMPIPLDTSPARLEAGDLNDMGWLIHELTHAWQFQHAGWAYLAQAIGEQMRLGPKAYDYGGEAGLRAAHAAGQRLSHFMREQQADMARDYYFALKRGRDVGAWQPYILEMQAA
jgi:hypothetical protein